MTEEPSVGDFVELTYTNKNERLGTSKEESVKGSVSEVHEPEDRPLAPDVNFRIEVPDQERDLEYYQGTDENGENEHRIVYRRNPFGKDHEVGEEADWEVFG